jgi:uridine kinase
MRLIGIAGGSGSGKTTIAAALEEALQGSAVRIPHDSYYRTLPDDYRGGREAQYNFDHPDALDNALLVSHLRTLAAGRSIRVPVYDFVGCKRLDDSRSIEVKPAEWVIVEGILVLGIPALRALFDRMVFVDCPGDIRLARRLRRDCIERGDTPEGVLTQYLATVRPMHQQIVQPSAEFADVRVDGTGPLHCALSAVRALMVAEGSRVKAP